MNSPSEYNYETHGNEREEEQEPETPDRKNLEHCTNSIRKSSHLPPAMLRKAVLASALPKLISASFRL
jgi:hypothetical protein